MAQITRGVKTLSSASTSNSTSFATRLNFTAAEIAAAGFSANDEVLVLFLGQFQQANAATLQAWRLQYAGATITSTAADPRTDQWPGGANEEHHAAWMARINLGGTIGDLTLQNLRAGTSANVVINRATIILLKLADFGTEDVDWFWDQSTTDVAHTTTYSATNRATITWTPGSVEDWVAFWATHIAIDTTSQNAEARMMLDGSLVSGDFSEEGWDTSEERAYLLFDIIPSLSAASHTLEIQTRDDGTAANNHRQSAIFLFRKSLFTDIYYTEPGTVSSTTSDTQRATITDTLSATMDILLFAMGMVDINSQSGSAIWIRKVSTALTPDWATSGGGSNIALSNDTTDELWNFVMYHDPAVSSGALDYDLMDRNFNGTVNMLGTKMLVWGLELDAAAPEPVEITASPAIIASSAVAAVLEPGELTVSASPASVASSAIAAVPELAELVITTGPAAIASSAIPAVVEIAEAPVEITASPAIIASEAIAAVPIIPVVIEAEPATIASEAIEALLQLGAILADPAVATVQAIPAVLELGALTIVAEPAIIQAEAVEATPAFSVTIVAEPAILVLAADAAFPYIPPPTIPVSQRRVFRGNRPRRMGWHRPRSWR